MTVWSGKKDAGERTYDAGQAARVRAYLATCQGQDHATLLESIANRTQVPARTVRAILSDLDGTDFVLAYTDDLMVFVAEHAEEAEGYTAKLAAQVRTMSGRLDRRRRREATLPRRQLRLV